MKNTTETYSILSDKRFEQATILFLLLLLPVTVFAQTKPRNQDPPRNAAKTKNQVQKVDTLCYLLRCKSADKSDAWIDKATLGKQDSAQVSVLNGIQSEIDLKKALSEAKRHPKHITTDNWIGEVICEEMPSFPEGDVPEYISKHLIYPPNALKDKIQGRVIVQFWVNKDGSIGEVEVVRGITPELDDEAVRVVESMPRWKPAKQRNQPVRCKFTLPVNFKLPKETK